MIYQLGKALDFRQKAALLHFQHNDIVVSMIPPLVDIGSPTPWAVLPPGIHDATLDEVEARFGTSPQRRELLNGFVRAAAALHAAGCRTVYLDGSFVTASPVPNDFDACWELAGVDPTKLDPVLLQFGDKRRAQKAKYLGELFIAEFTGVPGMSFLELFQNEKYSNRPKGILRLQLPLGKGSIS